MSADDLPLDADAFEGLSLIEAALHGDGEFAQSPDSLLERGEIPAAFDGFELKQLLGRGGMGEVYLARQVALRRDVALKVRLAPSCDAVDVDELLAREARTLAALEHPGIVRVLDMGTVAGRRYLVMEKVHGRTLRQWLERRPDGLSPAAALSVARGIADALAAAHASGVVHRDLKPSNVLVGRATGAAARVRLVDFGIAGRAFAAGEASELGTWEAMAPEQRAGGPVGPPADVYALGLLLSTMVGGRGDVPGELHRLIAIFSAADPARRPRDGAEAGERLAALAKRTAGRGHRARGDRAAGPGTSPPLVRDPRVWVLVATLLLLILTAFGDGWFGAEAEPAANNALLDERPRGAPGAAPNPGAPFPGPGAERRPFRPGPGRDGPRAGAQRPPRDGALPPRALRPRGPRGELQGPGRRAPPESGEPPLDAEGAPPPLGPGEGG